MNVFDLSGRKALVTGGAQGLGAAAARALISAGADVLLADINQDLGIRMATELGARGCVALDVRDDRQWETAIDQAVKQLGGFDILINNAGVEETEFVIDTDADRLRNMLDVNVVGTTLGIKHAFRVMRPEGPAGKGGVVINVASVAATIAFPGIAGYSATKSAVDRITRVAAAEAGRLGYNVRVNCVYPGLVATEMGIKLAQETAALGLFESAEAAVEAVSGLTPLGRLGAPEEIADALVFLATDAARFITGAGLPIDGGMGM